MKQETDDLGYQLEHYVDPVDSPAGRKQSMAALRKYLKAVLAKDIDTVRSLMWDDVIIELPFNESGKTDQASYRIYRGMKEVLEFWNTAFKAEGDAEGLNEADITMNADGTRIFIEARGKMTMPSGREYRNRYVMRFDFHDGKLRHCKEYYNPIQSAYAFGRVVAGKYKIDSL